MRPAVVHALLRLLTLLPLSGNHCLGGLIGWLYALVPNRRRRVAQMNIQLCYPGQGEKWRRALMINSLKETSKAFTELGPLWFWGEKRLIESVVEVSGAEIIERALANGNGLIIMFPHIGSWEMVNLYVSSRFRLHLTTLFQSPQMQALQSLMRCGRERFGAHLVPCHSGSVRTLYKALLAGEVIAISPDQEPRRNAGVWVPFFGTPTYTMSLLSRLAQKTRAPVVAAMMERLSAGKGYKLHYLPVSDEIYDADPTISATAVNGAVEACIAIDPAQYLWSYKRFRHRPDGQKRFY